MTGKSVSSESEHVKGSIMFQTSSIIQDMKETDTGNEVVVYLNEMLAIEANHLSDGSAKRLVLFTAQHHGTCRSRM